MSLSNCSALSTDLWSAVKHVAAVWDTLYTHVINHAHFQMIMCSELRCYENFKSFIPISKSYFMSFKMRGH